MGGGRSYEFNPETSDPKSFSRSRLREHTEKVTKGQEDAPHGREKISYGRKFAQTEDLYVARQMNRELEELARQDGSLGKEGKGGAAKKKPAPAAKKARPVTMEDLTRTQPIGSVPGASEPPPRQAFGELLTDATRYAGMIRTAVRDIVTASVRLARLPVEAAVLTAARLRPLRS